MPSKLCNITPEKNTGDLGEITMTKNANLPAMPSGVLQDGHNAGNYPLNAGLTKLELFCLHHGVPETGDPVIHNIPL
jgi:hypothetical protein